VQENRSKTADQRRDQGGNDGFDEADFAFPDEDGERQTRLQDNENVEGRRGAGLANRNRLSEEQNDAATKVGRVHANNNTGISSRVQQSSYQQSSKMARNQSVRQSARGDPSHNPIFELRPERNDDELGSGVTQTRSNTRVQSN